MRDFEKTALSPMALGRGAQKVVGDLSQIASGKPSSFRKALVGSFGDVDLGPKAVTGRLGTFDADLYDARRYQKRLQRAGLGSADVGLRDGGDVDINVLDKVQGALPGYMARLRMGLTRGEGRAKYQQQLLKDLKDAGIDATPEQLMQLTRGGTGLKETARSLKNFVWGEAPVQTIKERFARGGLLGRGGVLTADLAPDIATRRRYRRFYDAMRRGEYRQAAGEAPALLMGTGGYAANLGFNYGLPGYLAYEGYNQAQQSGESPAKSIAASLAASGANIAMAPFGAMQMFTLDPVQRGIYKGFGVKPPEELSVQLAEGTNPRAHAAMANQIQQQRMSARPTGYRQALQTQPASPMLPYPRG